MIFMVPISAAKADGDKSREWPHGTVNRGMDRVDRWSEAKIIFANYL